MERVAFPVFRVTCDKHWRLYFDEAALERMGTDKTAGLILHEIEVARLEAELCLKERTIQLLMRQQRDRNPTLRNTVATPNVPSPSQ